MGTGQMFLTLGSMLMFSLLMLRMNTNILATEDLLMNGKFGVLATTLASSVMEEASSKAFDQATVDNSVSALSQITASASLGPDGSETYASFNDFDDFNGFHRVDASLPSAVFDIRARVTYAEPTAPNLVAAGKTWHKKIEVTVTSVSMQDTVRLSTIFSYWTFR
ncbi:MAG: hypothetical protein HY962_06495 [Ignavibacteriae bacterium]|nr:hypothetical protein [Ignavibacteriota bacterium]